MFPILSGLSLIVLAAFTSGCHKRHVAVPLAPIPAPAESTAPPAPAPPAPAPAPPQNPQPQEKPSPLGPPAAQPSQPPQGVQPTPPAQPPPANAPQQQPQQPSRRTTPPNPPAAAPRLGDIMTPDQERQYNLAIDQSLARAENSLKAVANRKLSKEQQAVVAQVRSFIQQAQTTRKTNLTAARSLAERADVLARDLAGSRQ